MQRVAVASALILGILSSSPASAQIVVTQAKTLAGNVTAGDAPGFPVTLSQPGAYVLGSNLTVPAGINGIHVTAHNVDIDMKGFLLTGNGVGAHGVISGYEQSRIHGGVVSRFSGAGIYLRSNAWVIEDMQFIRNGGGGIDASGSRYITVKNSSVLASGNTGIRVGADGRIEASNVSSNRGDGVHCRAGCYVAGSTLNENTMNGILADQDGGAIIDNSLSKNGRYGIYASYYNGDFTIPLILGFGGNSVVLNGLGPRSGGFEIGSNFCFPQTC